MRRLSATVLLLSACATAAPRSAAPARDAEAEVVAAEHAFAAAVARDGIRDAFLAFAHDSALAFTPEPANAKAVWRARPRVSERLAWYPAFARAARSGDLGFTTGPYESADSAGNVLGHGQYVTVWQRTAEGWRFVIDAGSPNPRPGAPVPEWRPPASRAQSSVATDVDGARSLLAADSAFAARAASHGFAAAVRAYGDREMRLLRPRFQPRVGLGPVLAAAVADSARHYTARPARAFASAAGDLGWTWGEYRYMNVGAGRRETGYYVRIWARDPGGPWRVLLDGVTPRPSERDE
ncbi:MAG TPA: hypothetical protein VFJ16_22130 [Longimicrobium sp.]|nr:hypothetical protein [Longimicrobium sp.]